jgi:hypothetical protein
MAKTTYEDHDNAVTTKTMTSRSTIRVDEGIAIRKEKTAVTTIATW